MSQAIGLLESSKESSSSTSPSSSSSSSLQVSQVLEALDQLAGEGPQREELRLRCYLAAGRLGEAARAALELARLEQVGPCVYEITAQPALDSSLLGQLVASLAVDAVGSMSSLLVSNLWWTLCVGILS